MNMAFIKCSEAQGVELEAGEWKERYTQEEERRAKTGAHVPKKLMFKPIERACSAPRAPLHYYCVVTGFFFNNPSLKFEDFA